MEHVTIISCSMLYSLWRVFRDMCYKFYDSMIRAQGIILTKSNLLENDELIAVYTREFGKIVLRSRGARKFLAKLTASLQTATSVEVEFVQGKMGKIVTSSYVLEPLNEIRKDLPRLNTVHAALKFIDHLVIEEQRDELLWNFLTTFIEHMKITEMTDENTVKILSYFKLNTLKILGFFGKFNTLDRISKEGQVYSHAMLELDFPEVLAQPIPRTTLAQLLGYIDTFAETIY